MFFLLIKKYYFKKVITIIGNKLKVRFDWFDVPEEITITEMPFFNIYSISIYVILSYNKRKSLFFKVNFKTIAQ